MSADEEPMDDERSSVDAMLARGVRRAHLAYSDALVAAIRADVPTETLLSWGIPWADIEKVLYAKGRLTQPLGAPVQVPCRDVFPLHRNPPPGPPCPPRTCSLAGGHSGDHSRDGVSWASSASGDSGASS